MAATRGHIAGVYRAFVGFRDSNGYFKGTDSTPNVVANNTTLSAYHLLGPVSATALAPTYERADFFGAQSYLGSSDLGAISFGTFELTLSAHDDTFNAYISGTAVDATIDSAGSVTAPSTGQVSPPQMYLCLTMGYQQESGTNGYIHYIYNNVQIRRGNLGSASNSGGTNPNAQTYTITCARSTRTIFGYLYSATTLAVADNSDIMTEYKTSTPISVTTYVGDNSETDVTLPYLPANSGATGAAYNVITKDGVLQAASSVSTSTGVVAFAAAPAAATIVVIVYGTNFTTA